VFAIAAACGTRTPSTSSFETTLPPVMRSLLPGPTSSPALISAQAAASTAIGQVSSTIPVTVVSTTLSTYGTQADGGSIVGAATPVWAVLLSGSFRFPSCGPATATPHQCPSPATSELVIIDARTGALRMSRSSWNLVW
jgi:hypothetical protein